MFLVQLDNGQEMKRQLNIRFYTSDRRVEVDTKCSAESIPSDDRYHVENLVHLIARDVPYPCFTKDIKAQKC